MEWNANSENPKPDQLWLMLGEMRGDLKYLVEERRSTNRRLDDVEATVNDHNAAQDARISKLEAFKIRVGVFATALGVIVPTAITALAHKIGVL